ncbi:hypothetical protein ANCDUO_19217 [Ancylostoma duodenale]|uniref:Uncharacterized protein n=1 Tax=Ancylostoma duodenale TaxID=51022 RepID=A0A0C2G0X1_9BILA|nr:hypothetical protein ANCDUO_19217 [Ancylostoma duodenale]
MTTFLCLLLWLLGITEAQKLVVIVGEPKDSVEHTSTASLIYLDCDYLKKKEYGVLPRKHGMMSDFVFNWRTGQEFLNFTQESDFSKRSSCDEASSPIMSSVLPQITSAGLKNGVPATKD